MERNQQGTIRYSHRFSAIPDPEKFNTCKHRSETEENYTVRTCCQSKQEFGWVCRKIPIFGLTPHHCTNCPVYEKKENI